jgi:DNA-binding IclR family transcriptional regulator
MPELMNLDQSVPDPAVPNLESDKSITEVVEKDEPKPRVQSALRTVSILLAIAESSTGLKVKDIMDKLGLSRQVTYHLIHTLHGTGIIRKNSNNRYALGLAAASIAEGFGRQLAPPEHLAPKVRAIVEATGETAYAGGWIDGEIVAIATARGQSPVGATQVPHGYSGFAHARASGKLLLALADPAVRDAYLAKHSLVPRTENTITDREELMKEFDRIRGLGYALDNEEFHLGLRCAAVPVEGLGGRFVLGISVPSERFQANFERYMAVLFEVARIRGGDDHSS